MLETLCRKFIFSILIYFSQPTFDLKNKFKLLFFQRKNFEFATIHSETYTLPAEAILYSIYRLLSWFGMLLC